MPVWADLALDFPKKKMVANGKVMVKTAFRGPEVEYRPRNHKVLSSIPRSGCHLWDCLLPFYILREYW